MKTLVCLLMIPVMVLTGCPSVSVKEHDTGNERSMVSVKAYWEDGDGEKKLVGGLQCQLVRKDKGEEPKLVAEATTTVDELLVFDQLDPGTYRFVVRGGKVEKATEEFILRGGKRMSIRVDVNGGLGETISNVADAVADGLVMVAVVVGTTVAVVTLVGVVVVLAVLDDDDDDDDDDDC